MNTELISRENAAWLAGIIEGEGSFMLYLKQGGGTIKYHMRASISVTNCDIRLLKPVSELFYDLKCSFYYHLKKTKNGYALSVDVSGKSCKNVILAVRPFLKSKQDQADLLMEFLFWKEEMRDRLFRKVDLASGNKKAIYTVFRKLSPENQVQYIREQMIFQERLRAMRHKSVDPQRLKRTTSQPLEMMV